MVVVRGAVCGVSGAHVVTVVHRRFVSASRVCYIGFVIPPLGYLNLEETILKR